MSKLSKWMKHLSMVGLTVAAAVLAAQTAQAACPSWSTADRFTLNGAEVTDKRTGLVWKRCSEGQGWNGDTCTGTAKTYTHEEALALAKAANTSQTATGWRMPNVKELASLADKGCQSPAIDSMAFPAAHSDWFWSSSPYVSDSKAVWCVSFGNGRVDIHGSRDFFNSVRLVRASQ